MRNSKIVETTYVRSSELTEQGRRKFIKFAKDNGLFYVFTISDLFDDLYQQLKSSGGTTYHYSKLSDVSSLSFSFDSEDDFKWYITFENDITNT